MHTKSLDAVGLIGQVTGYQATSSTTVSSRFTDATVFNSSLPPDSSQQSHTDHLSLKISSVLGVSKICCRSVMSVNRSAPSAGCARRAESVDYISLEPNRLVSTALEKTARNQ